MKTMYKEEVVRKKLPVVLGLLLLLVVTIFTSDMIERLQLRGHSIGSVTSPILMIAMTVTIVFSILKCRERYRYSIIADQIIIHKIINDEHVVVENIKLKDIEFVGRGCDIKSKLDIKSTKYYVCSIFKLRTYCCIYRQENHIKKFYFQPSESFIRKVNSMIQDEKKKAS